MNRILALTILPARVPRTLSRAAALAGLWSLLALQASAQSPVGATGAANTLGGRGEAIAEDLIVGIGYILTLAGYVLGGAALIVGIYALWQHSKNPNHGQNRFGYGIVSILCGGAFLTASLIATFAGQTLSGSGPTNTGTAQQMTFQ